jgi:hypothetical protein
VRDFIRDSSISKLEWDDETDHLELPNILGERKITGDSILLSKVDPLVEMMMIFDSGGTTSMCPDISYFDYIENYYAPISVGNGAKIYAYGRGTVGVLKDVLYVPDMIVGIISIGRLDDEGFTSVFEGSRVRIYDEENQLFLTGSKSNGLYYLDDEINAESLNYVLVANGSAPKKWKSQLLGGNNLELLHHRWGHVSEHVIKEGLKNESVKGSLVDYGKIKNESIRICPDCLKGKMTHLPKTVSDTDYSNKPKFNIVSTDDKGPFRVESFSGHYKYFDLFSFKSSRWLSVLFKKKKNEFYDNLKQIIFDCSVMKEEIQEIQTDDAELYKSVDMNIILRDAKIKQRYTAAYESSSNGWIEREMRSVLEKARTIMNIYDCPLRFWNYAIDTAVYLINRTPRQSLEWKTPYEKVYGEIPDISNLVPFYSPGICYISKAEKDHPLQANGQECRMLGYDDAGKNVYLIFNCESGKVERRENVRFDEGIDFERKEEEPMSTNPRFKYINLDEKTIRNNNDFFDDLDDAWSDERAMIVEIIDTDEGHNTSLEKKILKLPKCPRNVQEAMRGPDADKWEEEIFKELDQIVKKGTFQDIDLPVGTRVAKMRMVLQVSFDNEFNIKYKARLVVCGYSQIYGVDYKETYSPTISRDSLYIVLYLALLLEFVLEVLDVKGAFLEGKNKHDVYGKIPQELLPKGMKSIIVKILNSLYGEKQAAHEWFERLKEILVDIMRFEQLTHDECIFVMKYEGTIILILTVHVDDIIVVGKSKQLIQYFKDEFRRHVTDIKEFKDVKKYLGLEIKRDRNMILVGQEQYAKEIVEENKKKKDLKQKVPLKPTHEFEDIKEDEETFNLLPILGKLRYLGDCTRPDILTYLSMLAGKGSKGNQSHMKAVNECLQYLANTTDFRIQIGSNAEKLKLNLFAFCDASHNNNIDGCDRIGGCFFLGYNTGTFYNFSKKDKSMSISPMHAEIKAIEKTVLLIEIYRNLLRELGFEQTEPTPIFTDSQSAVKLFKSLKTMKKVKGVRRAVHNIRLALNTRMIKLVFIDGEHNVADIHTKLLATKQFETCSNRLQKGFTEEEIQILTQSRNEIVEVDKRVISSPI